MVRATSPSPRARASVGQRRHAIRRVAGGLLSDIRSAQETSSRPPVLGSIRYRMLGRNAAPGRHRFTRKGRMELTLGLFHKGSNTFKEVRKLSAGEYADYNEAASTLMRFLNDRDRFQDVLSAFFEYMDVVAHHEDLLRAHRSFDRAVLKRELNSRLSNYLRATRSYVDHSDKALSDRYGKKSAQRSAFEAATNEVYDGRFSYRLLEQVRNYTQHVGEAIGHISYGWRALDPKTRTEEAYLDISFDRDTFLEWKKLKASFRSELAQHPEKIPVTEQLQGTTGCINYLNRVVIMQQLEDFEAAAKHIEGVFASLREMDGRPVIYTFEVPEMKVGERGAFNLQVADWIPADLARFVLETHAKVGEENQGGAAVPPHSDAGPPAS